MSMFRRPGIFGLFGLISLLFMSCIKSGPSDAELQANETKELRLYIASHNITVTPTPSGLYYMPIDTGKGVKPDSTDVVLYNFSLRLTNDNIIATNIDSVARAKGIYSSNGFYFPDEERILWLLAGQQEGLKMMKEGGKATLILPSNLAFGKYGYSQLNIAGYTTLIFDIHLIKVIPDPKAYEQTLIRQYLDTVAKGKFVEISDSGIYHIIDVAGSGAFPTTGNIVSFTFKECLINGRLINSSNDANGSISYTVGTSNEIPGFQQGILLMKNGERGRLIIPYAKAYGEPPYYYYQPPYYFSLPPFSTLVFDITITNLR